MMVSVLPLASQESSNSSNGLPSGSEELELAEEVGVGVAGDEEEDAGLGMSFLIADVVEAEEVVEPELANTRALSDDRLWFEYLLAYSSLKFSKFCGSEISFSEANLF